MAGMQWNKKGLIYAPSGELWWAQNYAHLPTVDILNESTIRVYFASLDKDKYGRIGYVDLDINDPKRILHIAKEPVLDLGEIGTFDDSGVNPSCIINISGQKYMYYIGWQRCERVPYMLFAGLAISTDKEHFNRFSASPVLERTPNEPFLRSATTIIKEADLFRAWYVSALRWIFVGANQYPTYVIRYTDSKDGINWVSYDRICIDFKNEDEFGFGRPWVIQDSGIYKMWYSIRSRTAPYRIGYAESQDGYAWTRKDDEVGIQKSESGWDSEMICYPCVININGTLHMFYNGNRHGATGFGYAVLGY
jgi:hypothetical protein